MLFYMPSIQTYLRLLAYNPSDRDYDAAHEWLLRVNDIETSEVLKIATSTYENQEHIPSVKELSELVKTNENDSIHIPELQKIIGEALAIMKQSRDPMHDQTHIVRAIRFAHILYKKLIPENKTLDWGIIVAALSWHDVYRVKNLGFLYNKNTPLRKVLRKIPWLIDIDIYLVFKKDSIGSALSFLKESKRRIPKDLRRKIAIAILGEHSLSGFQESIFPGISLYKTIVFCADTLDLISISRACNGWRSIQKKGLMDMRWYNRLLVLNILSGLPRLEQHPSFAIALDLYQIIKQSTYEYVSRFFPTDAKLLSGLMNQKPIVQ